LTKRNVFREVKKVLLKNIRIKILFYNMVLTEDQKIDFAIMVRDNKELLFGKFDRHGVEISGYTKRLKWEEIVHELQSNGAVIKSVHHLRSVSPCLTS
jgi:hypothetical protein